MKYILSDNIALRSFRLVPYAYYTKGYNFASGLKEDEFAFLLSCDGTCETEQNEMAEALIKRGLIRKYRDGDRLTEWQRFKFCDNRYMPLMNLQITAKCNYNCIHCFNAVDNSPLLSEMSFEEISALLDEAKDCGINALLITGGEPMVHKRFMDIIREIYKHDMFVFELNTNGFYLNQEILDEFKRLKCNPLIKISFDGIGFHDWMRGRKGAEEDALRAIRLCVSNGFSVMAQYNINKKNISTVDESLDLLDSIGVQTTRLIRTTPAPRWEQNAKGQTFDIPEYYETSLDIIKQYIGKPHRATLNIWQICNIFPKSKTYDLAAVRDRSQRFRETLPLCKGTRGMIAVGANGQVYPCMQMSGWFDGHSVDLGNVKRDGLKSILQSGKYLDCVCQTIGDRMAKNGKCGKCPYIESCLGGCPALAILGSDGDILAPDPTKCYFYENGYYDKFKDILNGYTCMSSFPQQ